MRTYTPEQIAAGVAFAWAYHRKLRAYLRAGHFPSAFGRRGPAPSDPNFVHCVLAAELADELAAPYDAYIEAHFWFEHRSRGRHPQVRYLHQRRPGGSADRVRDWQRTQAERPTGRVIAEGRAEHATERERFAVQERYLRQLCARWRAGPDEVLRALGGAEAGVFDPSWLSTQPIWRRLSAQGHYARTPGPDLGYLRACRERSAAP